MRTVESYRGVQVHIFESDEEVPSWVHNEVGQGRAVMARGSFSSTAGLAHILDRYLDEMLRGEARPIAAPSLVVGGHQRLAQR